MLQPTETPTTSRPRLGPKALRGDPTRRAARGSLVATRHSRRDFWRKRALALADLSAIVVALLASGLLAPAGRDLSDHFLLGLATLPVWLLIFKLYGLYDRDPKRVSHSTVDDIPWVFHALLVGAWLLWAYYKLILVPPLPLLGGFTFAAGAMASVLLLRSLMRRVCLRLLPPERVILVGGEEMARILVRKIGWHPEYGLKPVGVLGPASNRAGELPVLGGVEDLERVALDHGIERIIVSQGALQESEELELLRTCRNLSLKASLLPQLFDAMGPSMEVDDVEGVTVLALNPPVLLRSSRLLKRTMDVLGSSVLVVLLAPVAAVIAVAIKLDSRGPVFFRQDRVGKKAQPFSLLKFRTMHADAEQRTEELRKLSSDPNWLHLAHDPRITRVGAFLRLTSLDELPQLLNVLRGKMSLVGPRPLIESEDKLIDGWARGRLDLTPGITGAWQVLGRTNIPFEEMVKLDYLYVTNWSLWTDIRLILRTLPVVLMRRGAN